MTDKPIGQRIKESLEGFVDALETGDFKGMKATKYHVDENGKLVRIVTDDIKLAKEE